MTLSRILLIQKLKKRTQNKTLQLNHLEENKAIIKNNKMRLLQKSQKRTFPDAQYANFKLKNQSYSRIKEKEEMSFIKIRTYHL
jgi:hypothetical protein